MSDPDPVIASLTARQIFDSRGRPTVEAEVLLTDGTLGRGLAPSGASTGRHEARELRDNDENRHSGLGVTRAVANVHTIIAPVLCGTSPFDQAGCDQRITELDGTGRFERLGGNAAIAVSMAVCRAAASARKVPLHDYISVLFGGASPSLPLPMTNILSGGAHAGRGMDLQDFLVIPVGAASYTRAYEMIANVRSACAVLMQEKGLPVLLADEGGLSPGFHHSEQALDLMMETFDFVGLRPGVDVAIALDVAASELWNGDHYLLARSDQRLTRKEMVEFVASLCRNYPIVSVEDPLDQDDWDNWPDFRAAVTGIQVIGDDLFATNAERIARGASVGAANAALIKLNQNGTLSGTLAAMHTARDAGFATVVSARSGETEDSFIADLAAGTGAGQIKIGSVRNSERLAKYNQLHRLEEVLGASFAGPWPNIRPASDVSMRTPGLENRLAL